MYIVLTEFIARENKAAEFEDYFGSAGKRAETLRNGEGFMSTELLKDKEVKLRYVTMDRWVSKDAYDDFGIEFENENSDLAKAGEEFSSKQVLIGVLERL